MTITMEVMGWLAELTRLHVKTVNRVHPSGSPHAASSDGRCRTQHYFAACSTPITEPCGVIWCNKRCSLHRLRGHGVAGEFFAFISNGYCSERSKFHGSNLSPGIDDRLFFAFRHLLVGCVGGSIMCSFFTAMRIRWGVGKGRESEEECSHAVMELQARLLQPLTIRSLQYSSISMCGATIYAVEPIPTALLSPTSLIGSFSPRMNMR
jgi:hypothetical protein